MLTAASLIFRKAILDSFQWRLDRLDDATIGRATVLVGATLGVLVSISSVGAGAVGVTALLLLYPRLPMARIVGSDIAHAVPLTLIAGMGHWAMGAIDWHLMAVLLVGSLPGIVIGSYLATRVPETALRLLLAVTLIVVAGKLASNEWNWTEFDRSDRRPEQPTLTNVTSRASGPILTSATLAPGRKPDEVARAFALGRGAHIDLVYLEPGVTKPLGERGIWSRRPNRQHAPGRSARCIDFNPFESYSESFAFRIRASGPLSTSSRIASNAEAWDRMTSTASASRMLARGSLRLPPKSGAMGPRAHAITAGTSSATTMRASGPSTASAARKVKPMPNPPIKISGRLLDSILLHVSVASASSDPLSRLFINSLSPSIIENSSPLRIRRSSTSAPGTTAKSMCSHEIMRASTRILGLVVRF